ncbi:MULTISPECIES: hypothetical protein [Pseudomonas syringae group]|uniref:Uncharacterized protein n=4 Tax=Pseudomonas syringae group TaxID=136849 RepID=A0AAD0GQ04_9PSED|nr:MULTISPECIES: hypothetical protein [Pseudomonas syringae group]AVB20044.1 hypothetical protein BKM03_12995 [Pseudomonas avellanae]EGH14492.1 hypothetical protein PSYMP_27838 [Pseudomonas amygdali pv. morsprunorum str. M302280]KWS72436.1 hypothetical protein AL055_12810 [Pseudomonas amygdali pv. morsprunorum]PHN49512.1 hypothetical protein AO261_21830 [Pseudomonas avellanae]POC81508.1 hypothetical protein BKM26_28980 [Pseudomonas avellanae]
MNNSIRDINDLPSIERVKSVAQGLALLDAIIMPDWESRYFSFNSNWDGGGKEMMASMRDGSGNELFLHFTDSGVAGKVLFSSALSNASEHLNIVPNAFESFKLEPAFSNDKASLFFWRGAEQLVWNSSPKKLEEYPLLGFLVGGGTSYGVLVEEYYEKDVDYKLIEEVLSSLTVTEEQLFSINPGVGIRDLADDFQEIFGRAI